ncbi:hypothetical protein UK15_34405 [Streptomyces variegatus]|uniref:Uncharacterized protein n=1 Tax=Streptomyces variegatus TaxID=284040 RepID=A0A0M2GCL1_9ACTN|nr:hypothetical protein UK15_34405 [Streptomyces variegatus]
MIDNHRAGPAEQPGFQLLPLALLCLDFQVEAKGGEFVHQSLPEPIFQRGHWAADQVEADPARTRLHGPVELFPPTSGVYDGHAAEGAPAPCRGPGAGRSCPCRGMFTGSAHGIAVVAVTPETLAQETRYPALPTDEATAPPVASAH